MLSYESLLNPDAYCYSTTDNNQKAIQPDKKINSNTPILFHLSLKNQLHVAHCLYDFRSVKKADKVEQILKNE